MKTRIPCSRSGAALVVILGLLIIVFGLAVTFLNRTTIERAASASFAASATTRQLADTAVQVVQGSIRDATTQGTTVAWTSQPGMIRNFDDAGEFVRAYKLYSSGDLIPNESGFAASIAADLPPASWATDTASWTDLNAPVIVGTTTNYPILDPSAVGGVEGFAISAPAGTGSLPGQMPVRWLYVLQDGQIVPPAGSGSTVTIPSATAQNPIIGRVAFWTDDETTKVNINTSSEGTYWDTPRTDTTQDRALAVNQPVRNEFQRYPGHPSMTSLAPVFFAQNATSTGTLSAADREALYEITPRIVGGGSQAGTVSTSATINSGSLIPDSDRLFSSVDELIFSAARTAQPATLQLTRSAIEARRFFLTAHSRAPETTLFNTPRVSVWPLDANPSFRTPLDQLMAFCTTINGNLYSFQRSDPQSATADYTGIQRNQQLYSYLRNMTTRQIPGFGGGTFLTKYPMSGGASERDQILTEIFDYIRTTNIDDALHPRTSGDLWDYTTYPTERYSTRGMIAGKTNMAGFGQVTPIKIGNTQGFGRFPVISEVGIQFIATADFNNATSNNATVNRSLRETIGGNGTALTGNQTRIEARLVYEAFIPAQGFPQYKQAFTVEVSGANDFSINGTNLRFPSRDVDYWDFQVNSDNLWGAKPWGGILSVRSLFADALYPARAGFPADTGINDYNRFPFISVPITVTYDPSSRTMNFEGGTIEVNVYAGFGSTGSKVQTQTINFPAQDIPVPRLAEVAAGNLANVVTGTAERNWWTFQRTGGWNGSAFGRPNVRGITPGQHWNTLNPAVSPLPSTTTAPFLAVTDGGTGATSNGDVVRSMAPEHSDFRLLLRPGGVDFQEHPAYGSTNSMAHSFTEVHGSYFAGGVTLRSGTAFAADRLAPGLDYGLATPDVTFYDNRSALGDWDNGVAYAPDGPYINKADEGSLGIGGVPYFSDIQKATAALDASFFSANRQIPSAGMFGSLPTGLMAGIPYRTLLFRPQNNHFGWTNTPRDHLLLDLFWMPVVEPYAISEPFSTAGKINMNYEIMPFRSMIQRSTGMVAALRAEQLTALPASISQTYKSSGGTTPTRLPLNIHNTLLQFEDRFANDDVFRSPSQVCEIHMVPEGESVSATPGSGGFEAAFQSWAQGFWNTNRLTGDNVRERIYANLLGRMTTKSNTFTVHVRAQSLKKAPGTAANVWNEARDRVTGEYRGSSLIERYINPNDPTIPDFATAWPGDPTDLGPSYKWRTVNSRQFAP